MSITITATELEDFDSVEVIEILVAEGDQVEKDQSLLTLESDKAMMEIPSPQAGVVKSIRVAEGDKVKQGDALVELEASDARAGDIADSESQNSSEDGAETETEPEPEVEKPEESEVDTTEEDNQEAKEQEITITATELEDFDSVEVIEILVAEGDQVEKDQSLLTLESDKAMMEIPSPQAGVVKSIRVAEGDKVKQGDSLVDISAIVKAKRNDHKSEQPSQPKEGAGQTSSPKQESETESKSTQKRSESFKPDSGYASPGVRKYARELGVDVSDVRPSTEQGRVTKSDVQAHVQKLAKKVAENSFAISQPKLPDFSRFGEIETEPLSNVRKASARHLSTAWLLAPHVTQFDDVDITKLESARKKLNHELAEQGIKLTVLPFIMKALVKSLQAYPHFNSSLNQEATEWIIKKYYHLGIAVDTPNGLVVPVFRDVDQMKIPELATSLKTVSEKARDGKLSAKDMQGGCMTITSLGGIGGRHFTPIINYPEVAILGVSRSFNELQMLDGQISERIILPLSLSYDHRAIDGAEAAAFITDLKKRLSDIWSLIM